MWKANIWFWLALALGALIRFYLVVFTEGTYDVEMWEHHARHVTERGLIGYYHYERAANHPPFISEVESLLLRVADASGLPFRILLRAPFALLDAGSAFLVLLLLRTNRWRFVSAACYWLNPLAFILSAYHGNTDSAVAFFLLLCVWLLSKEKTIGAGMALGVSFWIKLPGVVAVPALVLFVQGWRRRLLFLSVTGIVALSTYLPVLLQDAPIVYGNVFGYRAENVHTTAGVPIWGPRVLLFSIVASPARWPKTFQAPILFLLEHGWKIAVGLAIILSWLRRSRRSPAELCATIAASYLFVYILSDGWSFQYFAWSLPFWFFLPAWFAVSAVLLSGAYIYSLYWVLCGNAWLLGKWDFVGHPYLPAMVIWFRNAAVLFFFVGACCFLTSAIMEEHKRMLRRLP